MARRNEAVAQLLQNIAKLLALSGDDPFRIRAYDEAAREITTTAEDVEELHRAGCLQQIHGVGPSIATKIAELLETGRSSYYEQLKRRIPGTAVDLLEVPGVGPVRSRVIAEHLGVTTVPELGRAAREHRLRALPRFAERLEQRIGREAIRTAQRSERVLLGEALPVAEEAVRLLRDHPGVQAIAPAGSVRRRKETVGDIDLVVASDQPEAVVEAFAALPVVYAVLARGATRASVLTRDSLQVDLRVVSPAGYGSALLSVTGSRAHTTALRSLALDRGWRLTEYGLFDGHERRIAARTEAEIYAALGLDWIPPELREHRGELDAAQRHQLPDLVECDDVRGDLHVHADWSDGEDDAERMVQRAIRRGYAYLALVQHPPSAGAARGAWLEQVREQRRRVERLNDRFAPFRVLHALEAEIRPDGTLDVPGAVLAEVDLAIASVRSGFDQPREQMTARILRALRNPRLDVLSHPTGRLLLRRPGYDVDMEAVLRAAVDHGVALEVNGQPERLDLDDVWARRAREAKALLVCTSGAHTAQALDDMRYAVATARRGWLESGDVLNTLPLERLLAHLGRRHARGRASARAS